MLEITVPLTQNQHVHCLHKSDSTSAFTITQISVELLYFFCEELYTIKSHGLVICPSPKKEQQFRTAEFFYPLHRNRHAAWSLKVLNSLASNRVKRKPAGLHLIYGEKNDTQNVA